jgi:hypothetical protein
MKRGQGTRSLIRNLYPGSAARIDRWLDESLDFRELCEDYRRCFVALESLRQLEAAAHPDRIVEYEDLLTQLAREIEQSLEDSLHRRA